MNSPSKAPHSITLQKLAFILAAVFCLSPWASPPLALLLGIVMALTINNPFQSLSKRFTSVLLQASVVGLGFGINAETALEAGRSGFVYTFCSITAAVIAGLLIGKWFRVEKKISYLISCGTAICGGSAIAAVAPIIKAEREQISVALGTVFLLNSVALFVFPPIAKLAGMHPHEFGLWSAIAIHDTSSVVGTASRFGGEALQYATTIKLVRALWIIPVALITASVYKAKSSRMQFPYFIGFFILAILISSYTPGIEALSQGIVSTAKRGLTLTLFLIGSALSAGTIREVGARPFLQGALLWVGISVISLLLILADR